MKYLTEIEELKERSVPQNYVNRKPHPEDLFYSFERPLKESSFFGWNIDLPYWEIKELIDVDRWTHKKIGYVKHNSEKGFSRAVMYKDLPKHSEIVFYASAARPNTPSSLLCSPCSLQCNLSQFNKIVDILFT